MTATTNMNYPLAQALKDAGFPQTSGTYFVDEDNLWDETMQSDYETQDTPKRSTWTKCPSFEELVTEVQKQPYGIESIIRNGPNDWIATAHHRQFGGVLPTGRGTTPTEAVANLYIANAK